MKTYRDTGLDHDSFVSFDDILAEAQHVKYGSLSKLYDYFQNIIMCMPGYVYWIDADCLMVGCNKNVLDYFGMTDIKEFQALSFDDLARIAGWTNAQGEKFEKDNKDVMLSGVPIYNVEEPPVPGPDGKDVFFLTSKVPLLNVEGEVMGIVGISIDITERKQLENELRQAKENAEQANSAKEQAEYANSIKNQFIMDLEHDLRTPFNGVCGLAGYLYEQEEDPEKKKILGMIAASAKEFLDYCTRKLDISWIEQGMLPVYHKHFDLHALLNQVVQLEMPAAKQKNLVLTLHMADELPKGLIGDEYRLFKVLINLVSNAIKYTETGSVTLSAQPYHVATERRHEIVIEFVVADTGSGMRKEQKAYMAEKFSRGSFSTRSKYLGLGMGLKAVKQFTYDMGGKIEVDSTPRKGTVICCTYLFKTPLGSEHFMSFQKKELSHATTS